MKKIFMLLAVAGMMTSCGGDFCSCVEEAGDDVEKLKACQGDMSDEDAEAKYKECTKKEDEGEGDAH